MIIDVVSDLHGYFPSLPGGDLLIVAGDCTASDKITEWAAFMRWFKAQKYSKKILVAGNHDNFLFTAFPKTQKEADELAEVREFLSEEDLDGIDDFEYLCDSGTEFEYEEVSETEWGSRSGPLGTVPYEKVKLKIWGTPHSLLFPGINPHCMAFTGNEKYLKEKYDLITNDVDILISHSPFYMVLDDIPNYTTGKMEYCGSKELRKAVDRVKPKIFICGHIHENGGKQLIYKHIGPNTHCYNVSYINERYKPVNAPVRIKI